MFADPLDHNPASYLHQQVPARSQASVAVEPLFAHTFAPIVFQIDVTLSMAFSSVCSQYCSVTLRVHSEQSTTPTNVTASICAAYTLGGVWVEQAGQILVIALIWCLVDC
jgi:hypothetical protein